MSLQKNDRGFLKVSDISCYDLPTIDRKKRDFYVVITIDNQLRWTSMSKQSQKTQWNDELYFDTTMLDDGQMTIQVCAKRSWAEDIIVGGFDTPVDISSPLEGDDIMNVQQQLFKVNENGQMSQVKGSIQMNLSRASSNAIHLDLLADGAGNAVSAMDQPQKTIKIAGVISWGATKGIKKMQSTYDVWKPLVLKIEAFVRMMDSVSEIHPYARMAWSILSLPLKAIVAQTKRDKKIQGLLESMNDIYSIVLKAKPLARIDTHRKTLQLIAQQTAECAFFISDYASRNFGARMVKSTTTDYTGKIDKYQKTFERLKDAFRLETTIVMEITVLQIAAKVDQLLSETVDASIVERFDNMPYARNPFMPDQCLAGTRKTVILDIIKWFTQPSASRVYWLSGVAGCGKSAVARGVADHLAAQRRCVSFFLHASKKVDDGPNQLFASTSRYLTEFSDDWKRCLFEMLKKSPSSRDSLTIDAQFDNFLLGPANMIDNIGPMLIIIDALDEAGDTMQERERLLKVLGRLPELPPHFRFLITSRPEPDINHFLKKAKDWVNHNVLTEASPHETDLDIGLYVKDRLDDIPSLDEASIDSWTREIVARSKGLFQWAATACKYIKGDGLVGDSPTDRIDEVLKSTSLNLSMMDDIYMIILDRLTRFEPDDVINQRFRTVMGRVLVLRKPLSVDALIGLLSGEEEKKRVETILTPLGSLLTGVSRGDEPIQPLHLSFTDFLTTPASSGKYWINMQEQEEKMVAALFRVMKSLLRFNICNLSTSYESNADVEGLQETIAANIPPHLDYACCYWMDHLKRLQAPISRKWIRHVDTLMRSYLLFWFEALSLMGKFGLALSQLADLRKWLSRLDDTDQLRLFVDDAHRFGTAFGHVIRRSAPHLYLSALPFIPRSSPVSQTYLPKYPGCLNIVDIDRITWPQTFLSISVGSEVYSVAFSPNSKTVVSGSNDGAVRIWSADTGELVAGPFRGHSDWVRSVAFSPDGTRVVSGSDDKTVRIWNVDSGALVAEPFEGHNHYIYSVSFSPDGQRVVSGSRDDIVRIWDARTGKLVADPFQGHTGSVLSVGFSRDGNRVISGSADMTVRIWDATTGELVAGPFQGHTDYVRSALFLPDDERVISCSDDNTIRIWNVHSEETIAGLFQGHTDAVMSMALSSDGKYVVSGSQDRTVRVWDVNTGELVDGPFQGHTGLIYSVGFSPDSKQVVSGSQDGTVRVWHVNIAGVSPNDRPSTGFKTDNEKAVAASIAAGVRLANSFQSHTDAVVSAEFSPDGQRVVTGSSDGTVRVWSAVTGKPIAGPFRSDISGRIIQVRFSPDGKQAISGLEDGKIVAWNIDMGDVIDSTPSQYTEISSNLNAFSRDFRQAIFDPEEGKFEIWDTTTCTVIAKSPRSQGHEGWIHSAAFSPNGERVAYGLRNGLVMIWNVDTGRLEAEPLRGHASSVSAVEFSPNGKQIVSGSWDTEIRVWNAETGVLVAGPFRGHQYLIRSLAFSPNGKRVVSGSDDRTVRVWDASTGELIAEPFQGHASVSSVAFSPDGNSVISGLADGALCMWSILRTLDSNTPSSSSTNESDFQFLTKSSSTRGLWYDNGWMRLNIYPEKPLFWIPENFYPDILSPYRVFVIASNTLRLDVSKFSHGSAWAQCNRP